MAEPALEPKPKDPLEFSKNVIPNDGAFSRHNCQLISISLQFGLIFVWGDPDCEGFEKV